MHLQLLIGFPCNNLMNFLTYKDHEEPVLLLDTSSRAMTPNWQSFHLFSLLLAIHSTGMDSVRQIILMLVMNEFIIQAFFLDINRKNMPMIQFCIRKENWFKASQVVYIWFRYRDISGVRCGSLLRWKKIFPTFNGSLQPSLLHLVTRILFSILLISSLSHPYLLSDVPMHSLQGFHFTRLVLQWFFSNELPNITLFHSCMELVMRRLMHGAQDTWY